MSTSSEQPAPVPWYVEHRMRALLLLIAGFLVFGLTVATTVFVVTVNRLKASAPYQIALERVTESSEVQNLLGRPVEPLWLASGQVKEEAGYTEMNLRVQGPTGQGTARAMLRRDVAKPDSEWEIVFLDVGCFSDFGVETVSLVTEEIPTGPDLPEPTPEAKEKYGID